MRVADAVRSGRFWLQPARRAALRRQLARCERADHYYALSARAFGPQQIRSEMLALLKRLAVERPKNVCEIGTASGGTNFLLVHALPTVEFMVGVDLFVRGKSRLRYFAGPRHQLHYIDGSSHAAPTVDRVKSILGGRRLDLLFIDGDHRYEGVRQDFLTYRQFVRDGGLIAFHDIRPDFTARHGIHTGHWAGDVPRFWRELSALYPHEEFVEDDEQDGLGIGLIRYSADVAIARTF